MPVGRSPCPSLIEQRIITSPSPQEQPHRRRRRRLWRGGQALLIIPGHWPLGRTHLACLGRRPLGPSLCVRRSASTRETVGITAGTVDTVQVGKVTGDGVVLARPTPRVIMTLLGNLPRLGGKSWRISRFRSAVFAQQSSPSFAIPPRLAAVPDTRLWPPSTSRPAAPCEEKASKT